MTSSSSCSEAEDEVECGREEPETVSDSGPPESETESTVQLPNETPIQVVSKPVLTDIGTYYRAGADGLVHCCLMRSRGIISPITPNAQPDGNDQESEEDESYDD